MLLKVPDNHVQGFENLAVLSSEQFDSLLDVLGDLKPALNAPAQASDALSRKAKVSSFNVRSIFDSVNSLYALRKNDYLFDEEKNVNEQLAEYICNSVSQDERFSKEAKQACEALEERLLKLLNHGSSLFLSYKAQQVATDNAKLLIDVSIATDIRPIFVLDNPDKLDAALILHQLKLEYRDLEGPKEFFVTLDFDDLQTLQEHIENAQSKEILLEDFLKSSGVQPLPLTYDMNTQSEDSE